jgi:hypothetical protein
MLIPRVTWIGGLIAVAWMSSGAWAGGIGLDVSPSPSKPVATITLSVTTGTPGTPLTITGSGFPSSEFVAIYIDLPDPYMGFPIRANDQGAIRFDTKWPATNAFYDRTGRVKAAAPGPHSVCGDTTYPGNPQPFAAKACAPFTVHATASPSAAPTVSSAVSFPAVLVPVGVVIVVAAGLIVWMRRKPG